MVHSSIQINSNIPRSINNMNLFLVTNIKYGQLGTHCQIRSYTDNYNNNNKSLKQCIKDL